MRNVVMWCRVRGLGRIALCALVLTVAFVCRAQAKVPGFEILDLVIDRNTWAVACAELEIAEEQQWLALPILEAYWKAVEELDAMTNQRVLDAGWGELLAREEKHREYMRKEGRFLQGEEMMKVMREYRDEITAYQKAVRFDYTSERVSGLREGDRLLDTLIYDLQEAAGLEAEQAVDLRRIARRECLLRHDFRKDHRGLDFDRAMDLFDIVDAACAEGEELALLKAALYAKSAAVDDIEMADDNLPSLEEILEIYELRVDVLLMQELARRRESPKRDAKIVYEDGDPDLERLRRQGRNKWSARYDAYAFGVEMIGLLLQEHLGMDAAAAWQRRADSYLAPHLTTDYFMDKIELWVETESSLTPEQIDGIMAIKAQYLIEREPAMHRMVQAGVQMKKRDGNPHGTSPAQVAYARAQVEFLKMMVRKIKEVRALLTNEQYKNLKFTAMVDPFAPLRPDINGQAMRELNVPEDDISIGPMEEEWFGKPFISKHPPPKSPEE